MKRIFFAVLILCIGFSAEGQNKLHVLIYPADNFAAISKLDVGTGDQDPKIPNSNPTQNMFVRDGVTPVIYENHIVIIRFYDRSVQELKTIAQVDRNMQVRITVDDQEEIYKPKPAELGMTDVYIRFSNLFQEKKLKHNSRVKIVVELSNPSYEIMNEPFIGRYYISNVTNYRALGGESSGFWFPTLQFSSNLKSTVDGVPFASLPIGIAWGKKYNTQKGNYIGGSLMGNWLIYSQPEGSSLTEVATSNSFNLQGATLGALIDFNDIINIGYAYGFNFKKDFSDPGHMLVIGFGNRVFSFFKTGKN